MPVAAALLLALLALPQEGEAGRVTVHSVCDVSQEFSFYMDGRFHAQYLRGVGRDARNWGSLHRLDLSNANLLVLTAGDPRIPYSEGAIEHVDAFARGGGTVLLLADGAEPMPPGAALARRFGAALTVLPASGLVADDVEVAFRGGTALELDGAWTALVLDAEGRPVLAHRPRGRGHVLVGSRGLFGHRPDAGDPINAEWVRPLLVGLARTRAIDPSRPHRATWAEHERAVGPLTLEFHDGTEPFADRIAAEYEVVRPHLAAITGVEPAPDMLQRLLVLPTGGGGFSSGARIAVGAWWGGYPEARYPMIELIAHEAGHSWVLPHAEPLWNEPIATYLGIQVGRRLGMPEAAQTLERQLAAGRRHDPEFTAVDPLAPDAPRDLVWGKAYFVFEELEGRIGPGALALYFQQKRELLEPGRPGYSMDDCVAVWSHAAGEDLFPWFRSLAFDVRAGRTALWPPRR